MAVAADGSRPGMAARSATGERTGPTGRPPRASAATHAAAVHGRPVFAGAYVSGARRAGARPPGGAPVQAFRSGRPGSSRACAGAPAPGGRHRRPERVPLRGGPVRPFGG
ncbi:hypothetical protein ATKI12_8583 [Kitasatospora sp. Ki12]